MDLFVFPTPSLAVHGRSAIVTCAASAEEGRMRANAAVHYEFGALGADLRSALDRDLSQEPQRVHTGGLIIAG
mgnify:CR=1 FL=1